MRLSKLLPCFALFLLLPLTAMSTSSSAFAQPLEPTIAEAQRLLRQGQAGQALAKINEHLAPRPKDAQGRFVKGLILTEMKRNGEAILIFKKLTEDFPELPEPYNNLAVLYANEKQYEKARQALEAAIRTHPAYAVAHENLGDIYAKLASQAYGKALQIDARNTTAQSKMAMIRDLATPNVVVASKAAAAVNEPVDEPVRLAAAEPVPPASPVVAAPAPREPVAAPATPAKPATATASSPPPVVVAATEVPAAVAVAAPKKAAAAPAPAEDPAKALKAWADAWSRKDVKAYLAAYAPDFRPPGGQNRKAWENERAGRIRKPGAIVVEIEKIAVESNNGEQATVKFRQNYRSANLKSSAAKTIVFVRHNGRWLIQQERVN
ncbi:MAG TPA: tetratricopeptide repeat protein [Rhodocyclaceae bacterium]|nr:tetratricopeptide repeat protein [Rhodocyclaceae bacterium]